MPYLADVNVWVNAVSGVQRSFDKANQWLEQRTDGEVMFCHFTMLALLRLLTNLHAMRGFPLDARQAWEVYERLRDDPRTGFLEEPETLETELGRLLPARALRGADWTDYYLAAFALSSGCTLVTFDRGFDRFTGLKLHLLA